MSLKSEIVNEFKKIPSEVKSRLVEQRENDDEYLFNSGYQMCLISVCLRQNKYASNHCKY